MIWECIPDTNTQDPLGEDHQASKLDVMVQKNELSDSDRPRNGLMQDPDQKILGLQGS